MRRKNETNYLEKRNGDGNKIKNSIIAEKIEGNLSGGKKRFYEKHP